MIKEKEFVYLVFKETKSRIIISGVNDEPAEEQILASGYASSWTKAAKKAVVQAKKLGVMGTKVKKNTAR